MKPSLFHRIFSDKLTTGLIIAILILVSARILILPLSPPGFYVDEAATGAHVVAMVKNHTNAFGQTWPLYSPALDGGFTTPVYLYPLNLWASVFGFSEVALRAFSQLVTLTAILFIALSMRLWIDKRAGLIAALIGLALPWGWLQGSIAWDPVMVPLMVSFAFFGWSLLLTRTSVKARLTGGIILPTGLILLAYVYPPYWASAPILFLGSYITLYLMKCISVRHIIYTCIGSIILALPLLNFILQPNTLTRSSTIGVFHDASVLQGIGLFVKNLLILINPFFLFIYGDFNLRHSVSYQGMLGIGALIPIIVLIWVVIHHSKTQLLKHKERFLVIAGISGFLISLVGSALTNEGQPQSLRACAAWPFAIIILTIGWLFILRYKVQWVKWLAVTLFIIGTLTYAIDLAFFFPNRSFRSFDVPERIKISSNQPVEYYSLALKYYKTRYLLNYPTN